MRIVEKDGKFLVKKWWKTVKVTISRIDAENWIKNYEGLHKKH